MMRRFARDALLYSLPTFVAKAVGIILLPIYARHLGPVDLGFIELVAAISVFALLLVPLEINQAMARLLPESEDPERQRAIIYSTLAFTLWSFLLVSVAVYLLREKLFSILGLPSRYLEYTALVLMHITALACVSVLQVQFRYLQNVVSAAIMNIVIIILNFATIIYFSLDRLTISDYFVSQIVSNSVGIVLATVLITRRFGIPWILPNRAVTREMLVYSGPIVISSFGVALSLGLDRVLVARYAGLAELGFYGVAARLGSIVAIGFNVASSAITPVVYRDHASADTKKILENLFHLAMGSVIVLMVILTVFSVDIIRILAGNKFAPAASFVFFFILSSVLSNLYIFFLGIDIHKKTKLISAINLTMGVASAAMSVILIPLFGVWGALASANIAALLRLSLYVRFSQKLYPLQISLWVPMAIIGALSLWNLSRVVGL
jgi:O-antigen/teichoic acid export membrane protein